MRALRHKRPTPSRPTTFESLMRSVIYTRNGCSHLALQLSLRDALRHKPAEQALQGAVAALDEVLSACESEGALQ